MMGEVEPSAPSALPHWLPTSWTTCPQQQQRKGSSPLSVVVRPRPPPSTRRQTHLEPPLRLLSALHGQDQGLASRQREAQLVPLLASLLGHVDDVAEVEGELGVGAAVFDALVALPKLKKKKKNLVLILKPNRAKDSSVVHLQLVVPNDHELLGPLAEALLPQQEGADAAVSDRRVGVLLSHPPLRPLLTFGLFVFLLFVRLVGTAQSVRVVV